VFSRIEKLSNPEEHFSFFLMQTVFISRCSHVRVFRDEVSQGPPFDFEVLCLVVDAF